ncbi:hypothetical protein [Chryseobacterium sp. ERMR1:04]|uniref:hypothetical protein n=1 Tax=Chryseobacterium sp. ERMR1:04 TaxID=1705393 RepID=UPI0006C85A09|nr:hypothetical protein [Chryseobacterium sp. ERMR1:04]KPH11493.1 hypothetical protein AMQ68_19010 [Chryseobacterium sp. ERMR1:04]
MKVLKIISIFSFLLINGIQENGTINFGIILMYLFAFLHDITHFPVIGIFWEGFIAITIIGTLITFILCRKYKDRYLQLFCFLSLLIGTVYLTGVSVPENYKRVSSSGFLPTISIFIISSVWVIILSFKKPVIEKEE